MYTFSSYQTRLTLQLLPNIPNLTVLQTCLTLQLLLPNMHFLTVATKHAYLTVATEQVTPACSLLSTAQDSSLSTGHAEWHTKLASPGKKHSVSDNLYDGIM